MCKKWIQGTTIVLLVLMVLLPVSAAGVKEDKTTIKYFSGRVETVGWEEEKIAEFEKLHPDIDVEFEFQKDASNIMKVKLASSEMPDITTVVSQEFIDQGVYADISDAVFWDRILPSIKDLCTDLRTGNQYKVATNVTMGGLFYNKLRRGMNLSRTWKQSKLPIQTRHLFSWEERIHGRSVTLLSFGRMELSSKTSGYLDHEKPSLIKL
jgi:raffinose/stachyose/melibiose transport system substrate-binding protein